MAKIWRNMFTENGLMNKKVLILYFVLYKVSYYYNTRNPNHQCTSLWETPLEVSSGTWGGAGGSQLPTIFKLGFKKSRHFFWVELKFFRGYISWKGGGIIPKIVINLPRTYRKLHCIGSAVNEILLVQIDTQILLLMYYVDITFTVQIKYRKLFEVFFSLFPHDCPLPTSSFYLDGKNFSVHLYDSNAP